MDTRIWIMTIAVALGLLGTGIVLASAGALGEDGAQTSAVQAAYTNDNSSPFSSSGPSDPALVCRYPYGSTYP